MEGNPNTVRGRDARQGGGEAKDPRWTVVGGGQHEWGGLPRCGERANTKAPGLSPREAGKIVYGRVQAM